MDIMDFIKQLSANIQNLVCDHFLWGEGPSDYPKVFLEILPVTLYLRRWLQIYYCNSVGRK